MGILQIALFGKFSGRYDDTYLGLEATKLQELLSYLILFRDRPHRREQLAALFWDASSTAQSKKYLRQALWQLQSCLSEAADCGCVVQDADWVRFNVESGVQLDVVEFEQAYTATEGIAGEHLSDEQAGALKDAVAVYKGDLLEGWYQDWCIAERARYQDLYTEALHKLMCWCAAHQHYEAAIAYGRRILHKDCAHERTHQELMRLYYLSNNRSAALRQYRLCASFLERELAVKPSRRTQMLFEQIQADKLDPMLPAEPALIAYDVDTLRHVLDYLGQMQGMLTGLQQQIENDLAWAAAQRRQDG
jgi:DNA-binding SARP family transcriptional activator